MSFLSRVQTGIERISAVVADRLYVLANPRIDGPSITQQEPIVVSNWDLDRIRHALDQHELGYFLESSQLIDAFGRDDRITGCTGTRLRALAGKSGVGFAVEKSEKAPEHLGADLAKDVEDQWWDAFPESVMGPVLKQEVMSGLSISKLHWPLINGKRVPRVEPWDLQQVYWDDSIKRFRTNAREGSYVIEPDTGEWLVIEPYGYRSWMTGLVRALGVPFGIRQFTPIDWARFCEKHGNPILGIDEPAEWDHAEREIFYRRLQRLGRESVIRLPKFKDGKGFGAAFIEPKDTSWEAFKELYIRLDTNIAVALLGQNLTTEVQGGSYAAARAHQLVRGDYLDSDGEINSTQIRDKVWKWYGRFNYPLWDDAWTPWPQWKTKPEEDKKASAETLLQVAETIDTLLEAGVPVDVQALAERYNLPLQDLAELANKRTIKLFEYHLKYGLVSTNEARSLALNLPPKPGGNGPPTAAPTGAPMPAPSIQPPALEPEITSAMLRRRARLHNEAHADKPVTVEQLSAVWERGAIGGPRFALGRVNAFLERVAGSGSFAGDDDLGS